MAAARWQGQSNPNPNPNPNSNPDPNSNSNSNSNPNPNQVAGAVVAADLEAHPYLRAEEGKWFERNLGASVAAVAKLEQALPPTLPLANAPMPQCSNDPMTQ